MSDPQSPSKSPEIEINVKGPSELKLQITISTDQTVFKLKEAIAAKSDVEADKQRLIYSGKVLKDDDQLSVYKIQTSHTIHMVKGASRNATSSSQQPSQPTLPAPMQTGQDPQDPLTQLNSHHAFGALAGFNPFAELGVNPNDPNIIQSLLESPGFAEQMASLMSTPGLIDSISNLNPQLGAMAQNPEFRRLISNPNMLRTMLQMQATLGLNGNMFNFPAPGVPSDTATPTPPSQQSQQQPTRSQPTPPLTPPFLDPSFLQFLQQIPPPGGGTGGLGGFGAMPLFGGATNMPAPEERFERQLQQLQDMGFTNASQNVRALLASGGNVQAAIEYILSGQGL